MITLTRVMSMKIFVAFKVSISAQSCPVGSIWGTMLNGTGTNCTEVSLLEEEELNKGETVEGAGDLW